MRDVYFPHSELLPRGLQHLYWRPAGGRSRPGQFDMELTEIKPTETSTKHSSGLKVTSNRASAETITIPISG